MEISKLKQYGVVDVLWNEKNEVVYASGLQDYAIYPDGMVATFLNGQLIKEYQSIDMWHAIGMVYAGESIARWGLRNGKSRLAYQPGGNVEHQIRQLEIDLYTSYDRFRQNEEEKWTEGFTEGLATALGLMRGTDCDTEWDAIREKWEEVNGDKIDG